MIVTFEDIRICNNQKEWIQIYTKSKDGFGNEYWLCADTYATSSFTGKALTKLMDAAIEG